MSVPQGAVVPGLHAAAGLEVDAELAQALICALPQGVLVSAQDGRPLLANARAIEITGLAPEQLDVTAAPDGGSDGGATTTVWEQLLALGLDDAARDGRLIEGIARRGTGASSRSKPPSTRSTLVNANFSPPSLTTFPRAARPSVDWRMLVMRRCARPLSSPSSLRR